ncbi:PREDICTED: thionin-like protein 2 [Nelumbo nucifera]|uniref:Thionin-like protein 2 n=2 Tax=Nelumbo nucifera TaxID=4432 RepID=A0A822ZMJ6_NELNU|nr:PREDICTED: thionin-like protein 2 [Nelumbo nucifera]DAD44741.1 TPA_asm: hypothetical protein HUJ06_002971 [Nelumbo nucifera]
MEGKCVKGALVMIMVVGLVAGQTTADSFKDCYVKCFLLCLITPNTTALSCSWQCLKECITPPFLSDDAHYYCSLGCASSLCTNLSTKKKPGAEDVEGCVNGCSRMCRKKY